MKVDVQHIGVHPAQSGKGLFIFATAVALVAAAVLHHLYPESRVRPIALGGLAGVVFLMGAWLSRRTFGAGQAPASYRSLVDLPVACVLLDGEHRIMWHNAVARRLMGLGEGDGIGRHWEDVVAGSGRHAAASAVPDAAEGVRLGLLRADENAPPVQYQLLPLSFVSPDGRPSRFLLLMRDLTRIMSELREEADSNRIRAAACMATQIAHEVRNPVAAISGSAQLLALLNEKARRGDARSLELLAQEQDVLCRSIVEESQRLDRIIGQFLSFSDLSEDALREVMEIPEPVDSEYDKSLVSPA